MKTGTKSLLFGAHQFLLHPLFLALAWWQLYGPPLDVRLWVAFLVHDWGYWGVENLDDAVGQRHPELGGQIMAQLFGPTWGAFTRRHSRHYARIEGADPSPLCAADKLVLCLTPAWLYLPMVRATGELQQYLELARANDFYTGDDPQEWHRLLCAHWRREAARLAPDTAWARRQQGLVAGD